MRPTRRRLLIGAVALCGFALESLGAVNAAGQAPADGELIMRGRYLAIASDCAACHTAPSGKPYGGGLAISSPVGAIYSSNITPSTRSGIGNYSEAQFARALRQGIRADGANLYPAMPYTSYSKLTDSDIAALYAYFMNSVAAVDVQAKPTALPFPLSIRASMKVWNAMFLDSRPFREDSTKSSEWNRGRYLVIGATHCTACHTPRGFLMEEKSDAALAGATVGSWTAPNITPDPVSGIGTWSRAELVEFLRSGSLRGKARAAGDMAEAVEKSFQFLTVDDLNAIATYLATVAPIRDGSDRSSRFSIGDRASTVSSSRGISGVHADWSGASGGELFEGNCASCHAFSGQGTRDGYYPSLFHNSNVGATDPGNLVATILFGVDRTTGGRQAYMPGFGGHATDVSGLTDDQITKVGNYVLATYGQSGVQLTAKQVREIRNGGPSSPLVLLAQIGVGIAAVAVVVLATLLIRRLSRRKS